MRRNGTWFCLEWRTLIVALCLALATVPGFAQAAQEEGVRALSVVGEGTIAARPDRITVDVAVVSDAASAGDALAANSRALHSVMAVLKRRGVPEADVQTQQLDVSPVYPYDAGRRAPKPAGFEVVNRVRVHSADLDGVGSLVDELVAAGANRVDGIRFGVKDSTPLLDQAREAAVADARRRAGLYAAAAGVSLGPLLSIDEQGAVAPLSTQRLAMAAERSVPVAPGELDLRVTITVRYAIGAALGGE